MQARLIKQMFFANPILKGLEKFLKICTQIHAHVFFDESIETKEKYFSSLEAGHYPNDINYSVWVKPSRDFIENGVAYDLKFAVTKPFPGIAMYCHAIETWELYVFKDGSAALALNINEHRQFISLDRINELPPLELVFDELKRIHSENKQIRNFELHDGQQFRQVSYANYAEICLTDVSPESPAPRITNP